MLCAKAMWKGERGERRYIVTINSYFVDVPQGHLTRSQSRILYSEIVLTQGELRRKTRHCYGVRITPELDTNFAFCFPPFTDTVRHWTSSSSDLGLFHCSSYILTFPRNLLMVSDLQWSLSSTIFEGFTNILLPVAFSLLIVLLSLNRKQIVWSSYQLLRFIKMFDRKWRRVLTSGRLPVTEQ